MRPVVGLAAQEGREPVHAFGVEAVGGLVEDENRGSPRRAAASAEPLAHAEREAADAAAGGVGQADLARARRRPAAAGSPAAEARTRRWSTARRPGWKLEASSTAPTWRAGSSRST